MKRWAIFFLVGFHGLSLQAQSNLEIPVLCYHHIASESRTSKSMYITLVQFLQQMQSLHDSGFRTIDADEHLKLL